MDYYLCRGHGKGQIIIVARPFTSGLLSRWLVIQVEVVRHRTSTGRSEQYCQNLVCRFGPNEGLRILIVHVDIYAGGRFQIFQASKHAASDALVGDLGQPAFHWDDPRPVGKCKVNMKSWTSHEPFLDDRRFAGGEVIYYDDMHHQSYRDLCLDLIQEMAKFRGVTTALTFPYLQTRRAVQAAVRELKRAHEADELRIAQRKARWPEKIESEAVSLPGGEQAFLIEMMATPLTENFLLDQ